jgi:large subunit ribosomal protein L3
MKFILGSKIKMSQIFDEKGNQVPVTLVNAGPNRIVQIKTLEKDGYESIQVGFEEREVKKVKKPLQHKPFRYLREFKGNINEYELGQDILVSIFEVGEKLKVSGIAKGKGFQGGVKRWGFRGSPASHGHPAQRKIGSIGWSMLGRVIKGKKMPGRMGGKRITVKNLEIIKIDTENNILIIKGAIPGRKGTLLEIRKE